MAAHNPWIHPSSSVDASEIGPDTRIWQFCVVLGGAVIGSGCNICSHCFVENDVVVGDRVTVKSGVQLWDGIRIEDDVFIGPNVTFTNDKYPRSRVDSSPFPRTVVQRGASIGANATILPGVRIGAGAMIGAGAVITRNVQSNGVIVGNPGRLVGLTDATGRITADVEDPRSKGNPQDGPNEPHPPA